MQTTTLQIHYAPRLRERTTMHLGGSAIAEVLLAGKDAFDRLPETLHKLGGQPKVLGAGSNIVASDASLPFVLLRPKYLGQEPTVVLQDGKVILGVDAGMRLPALLAFAARKGFSGLEGLCGIPGSVGGAVYMNAGSYGAEIGSMVYQLEAITPLGPQVLSAADVQFAYRKSTILPLAPWFLLSRVWLQLSHGKQEIIRLLMRENFMKKRETQPITAWSAGCAFKNPAGYSAGQLLDEAGFKGKELGGMMFSPKHANFLVNTGSGTFAAAYDLIEMAKSVVQQRFGINLQLEVRIWQ